METEGTRAHVFEGGERAVDSSPRNARGGDQGGSQGQERAEFGSASMKREKDTDRSFMSATGSGNSCQTPSRRRLAANFKMD